MVYASCGETKLAQLNSQSISVLVFVVKLVHVRPCFEMVTSIVRIAVNMYL